MQSRASIDGHPLHPALVSHPLALLTTAFGFKGRQCARQDAHRGVLGKGLTA